MKSTTDASGDGAAIPTVHASERADSPRIDVSWVARCQRQFGATDRRLRNLVDDENCAFYDGV